MRKLVTITALMAVGTASVSCADSQSTANAPQTPQVSYEPLASVDRGPLPPPAGYGSAPAQVTDSRVPSDANGYGSEMGWKRSPRWADIKGSDSVDPKKP